MLRRENRFSGLGSVRPALRHGQKIRGKRMAASVLKSRTPNHRFSILVSKKVSKKAVVRNRIRRRLIAVLEQEIANLITTPFDVVISVFDKNIAECPFAEVENEVKNLLVRAKLYS